MRDEDVAEAHGEGFPIADEGWLVNSPIEDFDFLVTLHIVEDRHLPVSNNS